MNTSSTIACTSSNTKYLMQDIYYQETDQILSITKEIFTCTKKIPPVYDFEDKRCNKRITTFYKIKVHFVDTLSRCTFFCGTAIPYGSENSHNVVQLNPNEDNYYLLIPYHTLMPSLKRFSPEKFRAIEHNPNTDLKPIGIFSRSDKQHPIRTQQFQELLTQKDTIQRQPIEKNLRKLDKATRISTS